MLITFVGNFSTFKIEGSENFAMQIVLGAVFVIEISVQMSVLK